MQGDGRKRLRRSDQKDHQPGKNENDECADGSGDIRIRLWCAFSIKTAKNPEIKRKNTCLIKQNVLI